MIPIPAYDAFIKSISSHSRIIRKEGINSWRNIDFNQKEPRIIYEYLMHRGVGVDYLNRNLSPILSTSRYEIKFASVYIHQKPRITRTANSIAACTGSTPQCELGDLLVVFCFLDKNKTPLVTRAMIAQAKKGRKLDSASQRCLYDSDEDFEMPQTILDHSTNPNPLRIFPGYRSGRTKALQYLFLQRPGHWLFQQPHLRRVPSSITSQQGWGTYLEALLTGHEGLDFEMPKVGDNSWNCIIEDLLNVGRGIVRSRTQRGHPFLHLINTFNRFDEYEMYSEEVQQYAGIPIFLAIARDKEFTAESAKERQA